MTATKSILFLGATGYIGSAVLSRLLQRKDVSTITVFARNGEKLEILRTLGDSRIKTVKGDLRDHTKLQTLASEHDIVFNVADADALETTRSLLKGMQERKERTHIDPLLIHTSGCGVFGDTASGMYATELIYTDDKVDATRETGKTYVDEVADSAIHRDVDLAIVNADEAGHIKSYIILPSTIYGLNQSLIAEKGVGNPFSIQIPALIRASISRKRPGMIGDGLNIWPNVHIEDVAALFLNVLDLALGDDGGHHGRNGYFIAENGEHTLRSAADYYGHIMSEAGVTTDAEPTTFSQEEINKFFGGSSYLGSNSRARGDKARKIGWKPTHTTADFYEAIRDEVKEILVHAGPGMEKLVFNPIFSELAAVPPS